MLKTPRRGLGRAYIDALPFIRGRYVVMGDADCTYDFRELAPFVERFREGYEFVMGSRWQGYIEPGSMPFLHRYFGTPVTTWILNRSIRASSPTSTVACAASRATALERMDLQSQSWEYASEMVLKSVRMELRTTEVPIRFLKDREGRLSHHKRAGWFSPWKAAWINLRAMFIYGADFFVLKPGLALLALGLPLTIPLSFGPITIGPITFSLYWMLAGVALTMLGLQNFYLGCLAQVINDPTGRARSRWLQLFPYTRTVAIAGAMVLAGLGLVIPLVVRYVQSSYSLPGIGTVDYLAISGITSMILGFTTFTFTLMLHSIALLRTERVRKGS